MFHILYNYPTLSGSWVYTKRYNMSINDLTQLILNSGLSVAIVVFYMIKDYKFNNELVKTLQTISNKLNLEDKV